MDWRLPGELEKYCGQSLLSSSPTTKPVQLTLNYRHKPNSFSWSTFIYFHGKRPVFPWSSDSLALGPGEGQMWVSIASWKTNDGKKKVEDEKSSMVCRHLPNMVWNPFSTEWWKIRQFFMENEFAKCALQDIQVRAGHSGMNLTGPGLEII